MMGLVVVVVDLDKSFVFGVSFLISRGVQANASAMSQ